MRLCLFACLAFAAAAFATPAESKTTQARPALWTITKSNGHTITMLGSIHVMQDGVEWRTPAIATAFDEAEIVAFEIDIGNQDAMSDYYRRNGAYPAGTSLRNHLGADEWALVERACEAADVSTGTLDDYRPWMAALWLEYSYATEMGYDQSDGVDIQLYEAAQDDDKSVMGLETLNEQLGGLVALPHEVQVGMLMASAREIVERPQTMQDLIDAWARGDAAGVAALMDEAMAAMPAVRAALLTNRNRRWVMHIERWLNDPHDYFVVVGTGHLVGEDSVVDMLRKRGITVAGP